MVDNRDTIIDFFRGIAILDMILVHFSGYFPIAIGKFLGYTDIAMEGFLLLAGFMVGKHYYPKFVADRKGVSGRLIKRAFQILLVQYILIFTINLPLYYILYDQIRGGETISIFLAKSMLFLNQIGLIHILPTFIPLFLISSLILYLFWKNSATSVLLGSAFLFIIGNHLDEKVCIVEMTRYSMNQLVSEACDRCSPCGKAFKNILSILNRLTKGMGEMGDLETLESFASQIQAKARCEFGRAAVDTVLTSLRYFRGEYESHLKQSCPAHYCRDLAPTAERPLKLAA